MPPIPVCHRFEEDGPASRADLFQGFLGGFADRHEVHSVYLHGWYLIVLGGRVDVATRGVGLIDVGPHAVKVVLKEKQDRKFPDRGEVHDLVICALVGGTVAEKHDTNAVALPVLM